MLPTYRPTEIAFVYAVAFFQGIGNIVFPASAAVFKSHHRFSDSDYGLLYLALIFFAILSSLAAAFLVRRIPLKLILLVGIFGYALSQAILALSYPMHSHALVLISISVLGIGFGFTGTAVNFYPTQFFSSSPRCGNYFRSCCFRHWGNNFTCFACARRTYYRLGCLSASNRTYHVFFGYFFFHFASSGDHAEVLA